MIDLARAYISEAERNHRKFGSKWTLAKAKKFFKTLFGTDKFVKPHPHIDFAFIFENEFVFFEAYVGYGATHIELQSILPRQTIGYYDFGTFKLDEDYSRQEAERRMSELKKEIIYSHNDWLHYLSRDMPAKFEKEIKRIRDCDF